MSSSLPFDSALEKTVQQLGLGPYDSAEEDEHGEDSNKREPKGKSLPDGGGGSIDSPETMLSYPTTPTTFASVRHDDPFSMWLANVGRTADLPGDADRPPSGRKKTTVQDTLQAVVESTSQSKLPNDGGNPSARSDYYDRMRQGLERAPDPDASKIWADEDSGAYASESLPEPVKNDVDRDNSLGALGNAWSGRTVEDSSNEEGFPSTDYSENVDFDRSDLDGGGRVMASGAVFMCDRCGKASDWCECEEGPLQVNAPAARPHGPQYDSSGHVFMCDRCGKTSDWCECEEGPLQMKKASSRTATNIALVQELTAAFVKKCGKKGLTRRHVMAFLKEVGKSQYFASDVIRCLKLSYNVHVKDVLDVFPVVKTASGAASIAATRNKVVDLEILHMAEPETAGELRRCAASLSDVVATVERLGVPNG